MRTVDVAAPALDPGPPSGTVAAEPIEARWLGRIAYRDAWALQHELVERRVAGEIGDQLLLLEHPAVLTLGRHADDGHVRASPAELAERGIELIRVERGGEVTYHGPGQLVAYPILALSRRGLLLRPLVRALEAAMSDTCAAFGVAAGRRDGHPGCWCDVDSAAPRKIGALGIRVERGVTYHGIALNVAPFLPDFELIDPCGMPDVVSTSIARELSMSASARAAATVPDPVAPRRDDPAPDPAVERAARTFTWALAGHLGAELLGFASGKPPASMERAAPPGDSATPVREA